MAKKKAPAVKSGGLRSLSDLYPVTRMEEILNGDDISPVTREEYFVKKAVTTASSELPAVTSADNGDVLTVVAGEWAKAEAPSGLPEVSAADNGDVLTVVAGEWAKAAPAGELPAYTLADEGKVLTVGRGYTTLLEETVTFAQVPGYNEPYGLLADPTPLFPVQIGDTIRLTVNGESITGVVEDYGQYGIGIVDSWGVSWIVAENTGAVSYSDTGTYSVEVELASNDAVLVWATPA